MMVRIIMMTDDGEDDDGDDDSERIHNVKTATSPAGTVMSPVADSSPCGVYDSSEHAGILAPNMS